MDLLPSSGLCFLGAGSVSRIPFTGLLQAHGLFGDLIGGVRAPGCPPYLLKWLPSLHRKLTVPW